MMPVTLPSIFSEMKRTDITYPYIHSCVIKLKWEIAALFQHFESQRARIVMVRTIVVLTGFSGIGECAL